VFGGSAQFANDLFPVDPDVIRRGDSKSHLISPYMKHGNCDVIIDTQRFTDPTSEHEHMPTSDENQYIAETRFDLERARKDMQSIS
jgi:hypothetical protein